MKKNQNKTEKGRDECRVMSRPDDVGIAGEHAEDGDLAESGGRDALVVLVEASLLEGHDLPRRPLSRPVHLPVRPLSDLL